jgi:hypothetical protein
MSGDSSKDAAGLFWPFSVVAAWLSVPIILITLMLALSGVRAGTTWLDEAPVGWLLLGVAVLALLPVLLVVLGRVADRGGSVTLPGGFGLAFAGVEAVQSQSGAVRISANLGAPPGIDVFDSGGGNIMAALGRAVSNPVAIVDLEDGNAWWETRLMILLSGGVRLGSPRAVAFTATSGGRPARFMGWAPTNELLRCMLSTASPDLSRGVHLARADVLKWEVGTPDEALTLVKLPWARALGDAPPGGANGAPKRQELTEYPMYRSAAPLDLVPEALLLQHMAHLEAQPRRVTVTRLNELFEPVLRRESIAEDDDDSVKARKITETADDFLAITTAGRLVNLISRAVAVNAVLQSLLGVASSAAAERMSPPAQTVRAEVPRQANAGTEQDIPDPVERR